METNWAAEHLQVIRTLMERAAVYRRALAPIMLTTGAIGAASALVAFRVGLNSPEQFAGFWMAVGVFSLVIAFLLARRQAFKAGELFWSPPTRSVTYALIPPLFAGMLAGLLTVVSPGWAFLPAWGLPAFWMLMYGCALQAAGFFVQRGIKLFGLLFLIAGAALAAGQGLVYGPVSLRWGHLVMGAVFGGFHLAYGVYLYFTEKRRSK